MTNRISNARLNFMILSEAKVLAFSAAVITALTGNANFPAAAPIVTTLITAQETYSMALAVAKDGNRLQAAEKNVAKEVVFAILRKLCSLVNFTADNDRILLLSSGFDVSKDNPAPVLIKQAQNVTATYGANSGELDIVVKGVKGHKGLLYEYAVATAENEVTEDTRWISHPSSTTHCTLVNMPVGQRVHIRVGVSGSRKQLLYSTPFIKLVA